MPDLSVIIPARKEYFLAKTIESILDAIRGDTEIIAVIDGEHIGPEPPRDKRLSLVRHSKPEGQRQSCNEAAQISQAKYILKTDAHSMFDEGFDVKLMANIEPDWIVIPRMYNLHAYDLVCGDCGWRGNNYREIQTCPQCRSKYPPQMQVVWQPKREKKTDWMYFRSPTCDERPMRVQYWGNKDWVCEKCGFHHDQRGSQEVCQRCKHQGFRKELVYPAEYKAHREWAKRQDDIADVMTGQGACWFLERQRFWDLGGLDIGHGSWGQMGVEIACKAWLSGGRHVVNRKTWFSHFFRCGDGPHFPYQADGKEQEAARQYSINFWTSGQWEHQKRPLQWIVEKFWPVPTWEKPETVPELRDFRPHGYSIKNGVAQPAPVKLARKAAKPKDKRPTVSVIIPARNEKFLEQTVNGLLEACPDVLEIIVGQDGPDQVSPIFDDNRVRIIKTADRLGMRPLINLLARQTTGDFLLKLDAHCKVPTDFITDLLAAYEPGAVVTAKRYDLDTEKWKERKPSLNDCRRLTHKTEDGIGLRALAWPEYEEAHADEEISESMTCSGSCYLVEKSLWDRWGGLDEEHGTFGQEGCEIGCKVWLGGGRLLVTKKTSYAHWNRGRSTYSLGASQKPKSIKRSHYLWCGDNWPQAKFAFNWLLERFKPPGWPLPEEPKRLPARRQGAACKGWHCDVNDLWAMRDGIAEPPKRWRIARLYKSLDEYVEQVLAGKPDRHGAYYWYLVSHLRRTPIVVPTNNGAAYCQKKLAEVEAMIRSIQTEGLKAPLEFYRDGDHLILWKGYRRLVILHRLGYHHVPCRLIWDRNSAETLSPGLRQFVRKDTSKQSITELAEAQFAKWGHGATDKYWVHGYTRYYEAHLSGLRRYAKKVLEIGVLRGASLALWREAFPRAEIYGIDIDPRRWKKYAGKLRRCKVFRGDETDRRFMGRVGRHGPFDVIIDDALHDPDVQHHTFEMMWPCVARHGWYVIEDVYRSYDGRDKGCCLPPRLEYRIHQEGDIAQIHRYYNIVFLQKSGARE